MNIPYSCVQISILFFQFLYVLNQFIARDATDDMLQEEEEVEEDEKENEKKKRG